jgi:hypothetical protein
MVALITAFSIIKEDDDSARVYADENELSWEYNVYYAAYPPCWNYDLRKTGDWLLLLPKAILGGDDGNQPNCILMAPLHAFRALLERAGHNVDTVMTMLQPLTTGEAIKVVQMTAPKPLRNLKSLDARALLATWPDLDVRKVISELQMLISSWCRSERLVNARHVTDQDIVQTFCVDLEEDWEKGELPHRSVEWRPLAHTAEGWTIHLDPDVILVPVGA